MRDYCVYMLRCADDTFYVGITNDVQLRLWQHRQGSDETCYTFSRRPLELVHTEHYRDVFVAIAREKQLKRWSRKKKMALMRGDEELLNRFAACENGSNFSYYQIIWRHAERSRSATHYLLCPSATLGMTQEGTA